jgi:Uncharacterised nucleotidyltransferase
VLVRPEDFWLALKVGREQGWETPPTIDHWPFDSGANPHELSLKKYQANAAFDVHQRLVLTVLPWTSREEAMTQAAWINSRQVEWEGARIRLLSEEDAFLFGLMISRCWGTDGWRLKAHDLLDGGALIRHGLTLERVHKRAKILKVSSTLNAFLRLCDPFAPTLDLKHPSMFSYVRLELNTISEHLPLMISLAVMRVFKAVGAGLSFPALMLLRIEVGRILNQYPDLNQAFEALEYRRSRILLGTRHISLVWWLTRRFKQTSGLIWPVMVYVALRRQGKQAVFKLGERDGMQRAWVELDNKPLPEFVLEHGPLELFTPILTRG